MRASVAAAFVSFSAKFEGAVPHMYLDVKDLCTTAIGNLIDPVGDALGLPWVRNDTGEAASPRDILEEWTVVKARRDLAPYGGLAFRKVTRLHLTDAGIGQVVAAKAKQVDAYLLQRFPEYGYWPADAQLGLLSLAWACGPAFHFPNFSLAVKRQDFAKAAKECRMDETGNPGLRPRNCANVLLFENAAAAIEAGADLDVLWWPETFAQAAPTQPEGV